MPTETRTITFTNAEIKEAIAHYCVKTGRIATYNGVIRILNTLQIDVEDSYKPYLEKFPLPAK